MRNATTNNKIRNQYLTYAHFTYLFILDTLYIFVIPMCHYITLLYKETCIEKEASVGLKAPNKQ